MSDSTEGKIVDPPGFDYRQRVYIDNHVDGTWRLDLHEPIPLSLSVEKQIELLYRHGYLGEANPMLAIQYGFEGPDEIIGFRLEQFLPPSLPSSIKILTEFVRAKYWLSGFETIELDRYGNTKHFLNNSLGEFADGCLVRVWGTAKDITEQKRLEKELRLLSEMLEQIPDGCIIVEMPNEGCVYSNPAFTRITGYQAADLSGHKLSILQGEGTDQATISALREAIKQLRSFEGEILNYRKDGARFWNLMRISPILNAGGEMTHCVGILTDISEKKADQQKLENQRNQIAHVKRVASMGELTAALAHELSQPLAAILSNAQAGLRFLEWEALDKSEIRDILNAVVQDCTRAGATMQRVKRLVKSEIVTSKNIEVNHLILEVEALMRNDLNIRHINVSKRLSRDLPTVAGDSVQLQQVILNLILNASQACEKADRDHQEIIVSTSRNGASSIEISVADNGPGIDESVLEKVFQPFFTTKEEGMGMGLALSRTIVQSHGGTLRAENNSGSGATFIIMLPTESQT